MNGEHFMEAFGEIYNKKLLLAFQPILLVELILELKRTVKMMTQLRTDWD